MTYRIKKVDGHDDEVADTLHGLDWSLFGTTAPPIDPEDGLWWLAFQASEPVAYAGMKLSYKYADAFYMCRSGVLEEHRGHGLQVRLLRARETWIRRHWRNTSAITDTTDNIASANSLIRAGYLLFAPEIPWALPNSLYWRKKL